MRVRIFATDDDAGDFRGNDGVGARRGSAYVIARLERDVEAPALRLGPRESEGEDLGVLFASALVVGLAEQLPVFDDHGPHMGVWRWTPATTLLQGGEHPLFVVREGAARGRNGLAHWGWSLGAAALEPITGLAGLTGVARGGREETGASPAELGERARSRAIFSSSTHLEVASNT